MTKQYDFLALMSLLALGLSETWSESYLNFYDAVALCRTQAAQKGLRGDLASSVRNLEAAMKFCRRTRGTCFIKNQL